MTVNQDGSESPSFGTSCRTGRRPVSPAFYARNWRDTTSHHPPFTRRCGSDDVDLHCTRNAATPVAMPPARLHVGRQTRSFISTPSIVLYSPWRDGPDWIYLAIQAFFLPLSSLQVRGRSSNQTGRPLREMAQGTLAVLLVGAKGLENTDYLRVRTLRFATSSLRSDSSAFFPVS